MSVLGLVVEHPGLVSLEEQRAVLAEAGVDRTVSLAPRTQEDWHYQLRQALTEVTAGDTVAVTALTSLGLGNALLDGVQAVDEAGVQLVSLAEGISADASADFIAQTRLLRQGIEAGRLVRAQTIIARAAERDPVTPPKAEFVERDLWEATRQA